MGKEILDVAWHELGREWNCSHSQLHHAPPLPLKFDICPDVDAEESLAESCSSRAELGPSVASTEHRGIDGRAFGIGDRAAPCVGVEGDEGRLEILSFDLRHHAAQ